MLRKINLFLHCLILGILGAIYGAFTSLVLAVPLWKKDLAPGTASQLALLAVGFALGGAYGALSGYKSAKKSYREPYPRGLGEAFGWSWLRNIEDAVIDRTKSFKRKLIEVLSTIGFLLGGGLFFLLSIGAIYLLGINLLGKTRCLEYHSIRRIGGCNALGSCGVIYDDGTYGKQNSPVEHQIVCTNRSWYQTAD